MIDLVWTRDVEEPDVWRCYRRTAEGLMRCGTVHRYDGGYMIGVYINHFGWKGYRKLDDAQDEVERRARERRQVA